ncbi:hypothetical protein [Streptomyces sp. NPDC002467]|uniref:hypothetical protein n=1 Tax=Streptomyces sp. NPDC002467 TaxID=3364647 RepID=UPI0036BE905F
MAADAPCTATNTASVLDLGAPGGDSVHDRTAITGGDCDGSNGDRGSILPVNLNGVLPMFNDISTNNNTVLEPPTPTSRPLG